MRRKANFGLFPASCSEGSIINKASTQLDDKASFLRKALTFAKMLQLEGAFCIQSDDRRRGSFRKGDLDL